MSFRFVPIGDKSFLNERMNSLHHLGDTNYLCHLTKMMDLD